MISHNELEQLRFPIGKFQKPDEITSEIIKNAIFEIESFPARLRSETQKLSNAQLDTQYRSDGWTIRQVVHHCADSHLNAFTRLKLALTEEKPTIKPYEEALWAELPDSKLPIDPSLQMLDGLHARWSEILKNLTEEQTTRSFIHPEHGSEITIKEMILIYAWHSNHHLGHVRIVSGA